MSLSRLLGSVVRENPDIKVILLSSGNGFEVGDHGAITAPSTMAEPPPWSHPGDAAELQQLRAQVQSLTSELQIVRSQPAAQVPAETPSAGEQPLGLNGHLDDHGLLVLGLDEQIQNKLTRIGYDTVGKVRAALLGGALADAKFKKDWLIEVGMKLAGAAPSSGGGSTPAAATGSVEDVPAGHADRPWLERLAVAKQKQATLNQLRDDLSTKQGEVEKLNKRKVEIPEALDEDIIALEENINLTTAHLVALRYAMNLDPSPAKSLDEALGDANLGPWMDNPQPRVMA